MGIDRRKFLKGMGSLALFSIVPSKVLGGPNHIAPSDQLTKGIIGVGGIGRSSYHFTSNEQCRLVSVCDVDKNHLQKAVDLGKKKFNETLQTYHDFRDLIKDSNVDIVHIATPPHWHGLMAIEAAKAGKDIWCEKPMTRTIGEGKRLMEAVKQNNRIFRLNTWFRFKDNFYGLGTTVEPLKKLVDSGLLGWPLKVIISGATGFTWKFFWVGKENLDPDAIGIWPKITYTYLDGCQIVLEGEGFESGNKVPYIEGPKGKVYKGFECELNGKPAPDIMNIIAELPDPEPQNTDFIKCVKNRELFALNEMNGHRSCNIVNMALCALRLNRTLHFDPVAQQFINDDAANQLIDQPMRNPWKL